MLGRITITERGATPKHLRKEHPRAAKVAFGETILQWHVRFRDLHFKAAAFSRYAYARRSRRYERLKQRRFGHRRPLEFSGQSRRRARMARFSSTSKQARARYNLPALNLRPAKGARTNLREEFSRVAPSEAEILSRIWGKRYVAALRKSQAHSTTTVTLSSI